MPYLRAERGLDLANGAAEFTGTFGQHVISQGSAPNFLLKATEHQTINANGDITSMFFRVLGGVQRLSLPFGFVEDEAGGSFPRRRT